MEWAIGIKTSGAAFRAQILRNGASETADLRYLVSGGLPNERRSRILVEDEMRNWQQTDPAEYLHGFGVRGEAAPQRHAVYEIQHPRRRILVPALTIMRAFFRPTRYLLPRMFLPQPLDQVRFLDASVSPPKVEFLTQTWRNLRAGYGELKTPISWMSMFQSAIEFAGSVHLNARIGHIGLSLPEARAKLAFQGRRLGSLLLATNATLLELRATERPLDWAAGHPLKIYERASFCQLNPTPVLQNGDIPLRPDGLLHLTDSEWQLIEPILFPPGVPRRRTQLDPRGLFDGVLRKLTAGTGWRSTPYSVGTATNVLYAYRRWCEAGVFKPALAALRRFRAVPSH